MRGSLALASASLDSASYSKPALQQRSEGSGARRGNSPYRNILGGVSTVIAWKIPIAVNASDVGEWLAVLDQG